MPVMHADSSRSALRIALLINSEVLCTGLVALLPRHYEVIVVRDPFPTSPHHPGDLPGEEGKNIDLLITSTHQWNALEGVVWPGDSRPKILVIGDDLHTYDPHLFSVLPSDGFLHISGLSSGSVADTIQRVMAGDMPMPPQLARHLLANPRPLTGGPDERSAVLTPREQETLSLLVRGMSNKQVARALGISLHGAKRLVATILLKLGAPNRTAAVVVAMRSGLA